MAVNVSLAVQVPKCNQVHIFKVKMVGLAFVASAVMEFQVHLNDIAGLAIGSKEHYLFVNANVCLWLSIWFGTCASS